MQIINIYIYIYIYTGRNIVCKLIITGMIAVRSIFVS